MKFSKWLWNNTFTCSLINTIKARHRLNKDHKKYKNIFYTGQFDEIVRKYLNLELDEDWIGRKYGVINPHLDIDGKFDPSTMIIEIDGENTNSNEYVKNWIYKQMNLVSSLFNLNNLYDSIVVDITPVGPAGFDNYLVVFDFAERITLAYWRKKLLWRLLFFGVVTAVLLPILL